MPTEVKIPGVELRDNSALSCVSPPFLWCPWDGSGDTTTKRNTDYPISGKTLEQKPSFLPASMSNSNIAEPKGSSECSARGSGSLPGTQGLEAHRDVIRDIWAGDAPCTAGLISQDQAGGSFQHFLGPWEGKVHQETVFVLWGHRDVTHSRQVLLTEHWDTFKGMSSPGSAFPASTCPWKSTWILPGTCCSPNISSTYPEHGFTC